MTRVRDVMTEDPEMLTPDISLRYAAGVMAEEDIGDVLVGDDGRIEGIITDRDIVIRALATGLEIETTPIGDIATSDPVTVHPDDELEVAVQKIRDCRVRRVPVVDGGSPVGMISLGDIARVEDPASPLAKVSEAVPKVSEPGPS